MSVKITSDDIDLSNTNIFGDWIKGNISLKKEPFKHCIINNFLKEEEYQKVLDKYPKEPNNLFWKYFNPIEVKYVLDRFEYIDDVIKNIFYALSHEKLINKFGDLFQINNLEWDPYLHGAGIHLHPRNGRLNMHLDYEKHPITNKQRRLNIIYYISDDWKKEWNGDTQLWDSNMQNCKVQCYPERNKAIIFETIEHSWHGVPEKMLCPDNYYRKSLAYYYVSPLENISNTNKKGANEEGFRTKAVFVKRPQDKYDERMDKLLKIRPHRRITKKDMEEIWPEWNEKDN
jgi:hypothetical protein